MTNAEKFQKVFGYYVTEMWAKPEKEFLEWVIAEALEHEQNCVKCKHYFHCCNVDEEYEHDCFEPESQECGKWIDVSERGSWATKNACDQCSEIVFQPNYNYCPNCGARMESDTQ